eukprot:1158464-Pelagomonas_calceolata.AAC.7
MQDSAKRARNALGGSSLPFPRSLMPPPPNRPQHRGLAQEKGRGKKNFWVMEQYVKQVSAASSGAGGPADIEEEEEKEQQQQQQQQQQQSKDEYACKQCNKMGGTNKDRMKKHLINANVCGFLSSTAAAAERAKGGFLQHGWTHRSAEEEEKQQQQ